MANNDFNDMNNAAPGMEQNSYTPADTTYHYSYVPNGDPGDSQPSRKAKRAKKPGKGTGRMIALGLSCALVGGLVGGGGVLVGSNLMATSPNAKAAAVSNVTSLVESNRTAVLETAYVDTTGEEMTPSQIYNANVNSCVGITTSVTTYNYWGMATTAAASGSGFVLTSDGYIVTNYHVVEDGDNDSITVTMYDGTTYPATLVGFDSDNDVAVLKVEATGLTPVVLGDSDQLQVGDDVVAIGNPLGELTFSLTDGVVSALNRSVTLSFGTMNLIQTDCAINSGNSGGPLFNSYGEVVGITNAKYSGSSSSSEASIDNIGFAIPINTVKNIVTSIIENGYVVKPYMGITMQNYQMSNRDGSASTAVMIMSVEEGSAAESAGLSRGDVITAIDGTAITSSSAATTTVGQHQPGDVITVTIDRNGETMDVEVTLGERKQDALEESTATQSQQQQQQSGGQTFDPYQYFFGNGGSSYYGY